MTNAYVYSTIVDAIEAAITAAFVPTTFSAITIEEDTEPKTIQSLPHFNVRALSVQSNPKGPNAGVTSVDDLYRFEIVCAYSMPPALGTTAGLAMRIKFVHATLLRAKLQSTATFAGVANLPYMVGFDPKNRNPRFEGAQTWRATFECHAQSNYFPT